MKWSIRTKVLLLVLPAILIMLGIGIGMYIRDLEQSCITAFKQRSEALAQSILLEIEKIDTSQQENKKNIKSLLRELSPLCERLYELYKEKDVAHVAIIRDKSGNILAHNDKTLRACSFFYPRGNSALSHLRG